MGRAVKRLSFYLCRPLKLLFVFLLFKLVLWQSHNEPPGAVNNTNFCQLVSGFVLVRLQQRSRHRQRKHFLVSRGAKPPLSLSPNAGVGLQGCAQGQSCCLAPAARGCLPGGIRLRLTPAPIPGGAAGSWSHSQLGRLPPTAVLQEQVAAAWERLATALPAPTLGAGLLQPAPTSELRCCNLVFPALLHLKKKITDSSLFQIWASPQDFPKLPARQPAFTAQH